MAMRKPSRPASKKTTPKSLKSAAKRKPAAEVSPTVSPAKVPLSSSVQVPAVVAPFAPAGKKALAIVGIGASAGGLEAIEQFLAPIPKGAMQAVIVVQHLEPTHPDLLPELLQRVTPLTVCQAKEKTRIRPDFVYVIPPGKDLSVKNGVLHLHEQQSPHGLNLPINFFFRSLAEDQRERSVAVVLSGMGADGTEGVKAIKEQGGVVLVQDPASAKFPSMPRSVTAAGLADIVAPAGELFARLQQYQQHRPLLTPQSIPAEVSADPSGANSLLNVMHILRSHTGHDFTLYKPSTLYRGIERRMGLHKIVTIADYARYLRENQQEVELLFDELLIGVTRFFRDPVMWQTLEKTTLPQLLASGSSGRTLRAWIPGCSSGEEAYTLAMVFKETLDALPTRKNFGLKIFATDISPESIDQARQGLFGATIVEQLSPERLNRFFVKEGEGYRVSKEIREMIIFATHNLIMDPPFTKLDLLSCRNLLIYFTPELQKKLLPLFHYSLRPSGVLFLGSAETIGGFTHLFTPLDGPARLFQRRDNGEGAGLLSFPASGVSSTHEHIHAGQGPSLHQDNLQSHAEQWLMKHHAPTAVLITPHGDIVFISGRTSRYLEPVAGKANWNLFAMVRDGLRYELNSLLQKAGRQVNSLTSRSCKIESGGSVYFVKITVETITAKGPLQGLVMIIFTEVPDPSQSPQVQPVKKERGGAHVRSLTQDLVQAREEVQATREAMQISQEELKSSNEELQSTNEELQSTNEELTTAQEELQSLNEELQTVNTELKAKLDELSSAGNDMRNLLNSTQIATLFLDRSLRVRFFTEHATEVINLIPSDVGRPVTDLAFNVRYPDLPADATEVLRTLVPIEKNLTTQDGRWFALRVMPYRTMDNRIDGVVITFTDLSAAMHRKSPMLVTGPKKTAPLRAKAKKTKRNG